MAKGLGSVTTYVEPALRERLVKLAAGDRRTVSAMAAICLEDGIAVQEKKIAPPTKGKS